MIQLSISAACSYVRRAMDELISVEDIGMLASPDAVDIHRLVEGSIVEAVIRTHNNAPSIMIDGIKGTKDTDYSLSLENGVITITMLKDTLRVASVQYKDSSVVVCDLVPENSAEGRKQLNKYVRGVKDDPRVVLAKTWADTHKPILKYYSTHDTEIQDVLLSYVPYPDIDETIVMVCPRLEYAVLNEIVAMVLDAVGEHDKAGIFRGRSESYIAGK